MYTYTVTDVANALGLTASALHFFEKKELIEVEKNSQGHRMYRVVDFFRFLSYTKYRSMRFPMKTIVKQFGGKENDRHLIFQRLQKYRDEASQKAEYYSRLSAAIDLHIASAGRIDDLLNKYEFVQSPYVFFYHDDECGWISKNRQAQIQVQRLIKAMPLVRLGVILHTIDVPRAGFGYTVSPEMIKSMTLLKPLNLQELPPCSCLHTIVATGDHFTEEPHIVFEEALKYAKSRGFEIIGKPWGHILLVEVAPKARLKPYLELWLPIA
jgi:DNA-binding transcriptional MerR regulator